MGNKISMFKDNDVEKIKVKVRELSIMPVRLKYKIKLHNKHSNFKELNITRNSYEDTRLQLRMCYIILRQHNEMKRMFGKVRDLQDQLVAVYGMYDL